MNELNVFLEQQLKLDEDHLNLLSVFHFVGAAFAFLGILFLFGHYYLMSHFVLRHINSTQNPNGVVLFTNIFTIFKWVYLALGIWFAFSGILNLMSGLWLRVRKNRTFSIVIAVIDFLHVPLGTILGAFTLSVLARSSVKELYETNQTK